MKVLDGKTLPIALAWMFLILDSSIARTQAGAWSFASSLGLARELPTATLSSDGKVLDPGGSGHPVADIGLQVPSGLVTAWGSNLAGETTVPPGLTNAVAIAAGFDFSLALREDGTVAAWGTNSSGQASVPAGLRNVVAIAAGLNFGLALKADGQIVGWGDNDAGQITFPQGLSNVMAIAAGEQFGMALRTNGTVAVWGQKGPAQADFPPSLTNVVAIAAGWFHGLALKADGTVIAAGNDYGGATDVPPNLTDVVGIAAGFADSLALKNDGSIVAWGLNSSGQTDVPFGLTNVVEIAAGYKFNLALKADSTVVAWGENTRGQATVPPGLTNVIAIASGGTHSLALVNNTGSPGTNAAAFWRGVGRFLHGSKPIAWLAQGFDQETFAAKILAGRAGRVYPVGNSTNVTGSLTWNTAEVPDGLYQLEGIFSADSPPTIRSIFHTVLVNNSVIWHSGVIEANATWTAGTVHVVEGNLEIAGGVTVTVAPGTIVKFAAGTGITVHEGAVLDASAVGTSAPTVFTSLTDDSAGGDTNLDGNNSRPEPCDWTGIITLGSGQFLQGSTVALRYDAHPHAGTLTTSQTWLGGRLHQVTASVVLPAGVNLTIGPGAVLKFAPGASLIVQTGATLIAQGSVSLPITFTSFKDDSVAGDSNGDGSDTTPAAGDWDSIYVRGGNAVFDHVVVTYGASVSTPAGLITSDDANSVVSVANSVLRHGLYVGLQAAAGTVTVHNTVVTGCDRGIQAGLVDPALVTVANCTVSSNNIGLFFHGGTVNIANTIVAHSLQAGIAECCRSTIASFRHCDVWSATGTYGSTRWQFSNRTGRDGNISADPQFKNAPQGNYRLNYLSPCIDAADSSLAPATDALGAPRYNDPRILAKSGIPADGAYADMGAFEFVETADSDVDLLAVELAGPSAVTASQTVTLTWNDVNLGSSIAVGPWHDSLALVTLDRSGRVLNELPIAEPLVGQGVTLGPGETYSASATVTVPGGTEGSYRWEVRANSQGDLFEGDNWTGNVALADTPTSLAIPTLLVDSTPLTNQCHGVGQCSWYKLSVQTNASLRLTLTISGNNGIVEWYVGEGYMPTPTDYTIAQTQSGAGTSTVHLSAVKSRTYYILVYVQELPTGSSAFTLGASQCGFAVTSVDPGIMANGGPITLAITGSGMTTGLVCQIVDSAGQRHAASTSFCVSPFLAYALFSPSEWASGPSDLTLTLPTGTSATLQGGLTVQPAALPTVPPSGVGIKVDIISPEKIRAGKQVPVVVTYQNPGKYDVGLPVITLTASAGGFLVFQGSMETPKNQITFVPMSVAGGLPVVPPGHEGSVTLYYSAPTRRSTVTFTAYACNYNDATFAGQPLDWVQIASALAPPGADTAAWAAWFASERARYGQTYGEMYAYVAGQVVELWNEGLTDAVFVDGQWRFLVHPKGELAERAVAQSAASPVHPFGRARDWSLLESLPRPCAAGAGTAPRKVYGVFVGDADINGDRDASHMKSLFTKMANQPPENFSTHISSWEESPPTASEIAASIQARAAEAGTNDLLVVSFGCHGIAGPEGGFVPPSNEFSLVTAGPEGTGLIVMTAKQINAALAGAHCQVLLVVDTCHSGAIIPYIDNPNVTVLTGCREDQKSHCRRSGGALTSSLISSLQDNRNMPLDATRLNDLTRKVADYMGSAGRGMVLNPLSVPQSPQFSGPSVTVHIPDSKVPAAKQQQNWQTNNLPPAARGLGTIITSDDPNSKTCSGWGSPGFVSSAQPILYEIEFENQPTATAAAQQVTIIDQLSTSLDWSTLELGSMGFNNQILLVPEGLTDYATWASVTTDPNPIAVTASFDPTTGTLTWTMSSIDPITTQLVEDPLAGFLPPNTTNDVGVGFVTYWVWPKTGLPSGTIITNQARIVFDVNDPILTPVVTNILDVLSPSSSINALTPSTWGTNVVVSWSGTDGAGSEIASYDIFVSADHGPWKTWLASTTNTSALFAGSLGHQYAFASLARDNAGNLESAHLTADAATAVVAGAPQLAIALASPNQHFIVSWPAGAGEYHLEASPELSVSAGWVVVTNSPRAVGGQLQVTLPATNSSQFFRLVKP